MLSIQNIFLSLTLASSSMSFPLLPRMELVRRSADFGLCSTPEIIFADGLDGRKETAYEPANLTSYNHGSADNINIISQFICDTLVNSCGANSDAQTLCSQASSAADTKTAGTGDQADAFNAVFGVNTEFASVQEVNDQGQAVGTPDITPTVSAFIAAASEAATPNFGSCSTPEIIFADGLDGRTETAFEPANLTSYSHGSTDNINIITQFMCNQLTNTCNANAAAKTLCAQASSAASAAAAGTGAQADAFNAVFGIQTDFAAVQEVNDQGQDVGTPGAATSVVATSNVAIASSTSAASVCAPPTVVTVTVESTATATVAASATSAAATSNVDIASSTAAATATSTAAASTSGADFGSCSTPEIIFAAGLDGRKETAFEPADLTTYPHESADNIAVITSFMCLELTNTCEANQAAKDLCSQATTAANGATTLTGAQADAFNAVFGIQTDFAAVQQISNTGEPVGTPAAASSAATVVSTVAAVASSSATATSSVAASTSTAGAQTSVAATSTVAAATSTAAAATSTAASTSGADFGSCSTPEIIFADGLDGRKETSFEPKDLTSYNHSSADNIDIITQFMCDALTNTCDANAAAKTLCAQATSAASAAAAGTGAQADAFNAVFGIQTDFAAVQEINDQGEPVTST